MINEGEQRLGLIARQREIVESSMAETEVPGVAVAIVAEGSIVAEAGFGFRNVEKRLPVTPESITSVASVTKSFTGIAAMQMVEAGKLWLDEPAVSYLSDFRVKDPEASRKMTTRMFLSHKSGMGRTGHQQAMFDEDIERPYASRRDLVSRLAEVELQTEPNASFSYCNEGYVTTSAIIESLSGTSFEEQVESRIFGPLGMHDSRIRFRDWRSATNSMINYTKRDGEFTPAYLPSDYEVYAATGGVCSTAHDLALYAIATMDYHNNSTLSAGSLEQMHSISNPYGDTGWGYGLGWEIAWTAAGKIVSHSGGQNGISTHLLTVPGERLGVVVLTNSSDGQPRQIAKLLAEDMLGRSLLPLMGQDAIPITTKYPPLGESDISALVGTYIHVAGDDRHVLSISAEDNHATLIDDKGDPEAQPEVRSLVAVGPALMMAFLDEGDRSSHLLVHRIFDQHDNVTAVLAGGNKFTRADSDQ